MAVSTTGAMYKALTFDGESSRTYGVYISGEAVFNAPERDVEMVSIPGRNGSFALDNGRYQNVEVTYPAGIFADNDTDFADAISDFRNMLCSRQGYCRLTDEYHPNEYRMAIYKSGLEVDPATLRAGQFSITFECKPQRWLTSGESAVAVTDGGALTNPTLYDAGPLLEVTGYGTIKFNGYEVEIDNAVMGNVEVAQSTSKTGKYSVTITSNLDTTPYDTGDELTIGKTTITSTLEKLDSTYRISSASVGSQSGDADCTLDLVGWSKVDFLVEFPAFSVAENSTATKTSTFVANIVVKPGTLTQQNGTATVTSSVAYASDTVTYTMTVTIQNNIVPYFKTDRNCSIIANAVNVYSTKSILGTPTYIDCDLGEAYYIDNDNVVDLNAYIDLGSDLPVLSPGANGFTYDNTITDLQVVPRWFKL